MVPGDFSKAGLRVFRWALAMTAFCTCSFFGIAAALSLLRGSPFWGSDNLFLSFICTPIAWLFVAVFLFGKETIQLPLHQPAIFLGNARRVLEEMGYEVANQSGDSLGTRGGFQFVLFGRGIQIQCADRQARITGPKLWVDGLRRRLRVQSFLSGTDLAPPDGSQRGAGVLLKRVQIQMRVSSDKLVDVSRHVLELLAQEAEVVCEISLLAQSDTGIRESTVEQRVRGWLSEQGIAAEIQKDLVKMSEPSSGIILTRELRRKMPVT